MALFYDNFCDPSEDRRMIFCERREGFSVKGDIFFLEDPDEFRIRDAGGPARGIDPQCPKIPKLALFRAPVPESVHPSMENGFVCGALFLRACKSIALDLRERIAPAF